MFSKLRLWPLRYFQVGEAEIRGIGGNSCLETSLPSLLGELKISVITVKYLALRLALSNKIIYMVVAVKPRGWFNKPTGLKATLN
jgi:hypothetical protein